MLHPVQKVQLIISFTYFYFSLILIIFLESYLSDGMVTCNFTESHTCGYKTKGIVQWMPGCGQQTDIVEWYSEFINALSAIPQEIREQESFQTMLATNTYSGIYTYLYNNYRDYIFANANPSYSSDPWPSSSMDYTWFSSSMGNSNSDFHSYDHSSSVQTCKHHSKEILHF